MHALLKDFPGQSVARRTISRLLPDGGILRAWWGFLLILLATGALPHPADAADFSGAAALDFVDQAVAFGPRPAGSDANHKLQAYILLKVRVPGAQVVEDAFMAQTLRGRVAMKNIIVKFPGKSGRAVAITGHYDTKPSANRAFLGANDGGSSTAVLLELAQALTGQPRVDDVYLIFFDGEEAFGQW